MSRETRLLLATIVISVTVLLTLARFRFPRRETPEPAPSPAPLARLAVRPAYDELAATVGALEPRVSGSVVTLRTLGPTGRTSVGLRVRDDLVLAAVGSTTEIWTSAVDGVVSDLVARDRLRGLALVRVAKQPAPVLSVTSLAVQDASPRYVVVAEAGPTGPALRPVFVGRVDAVRDPAWAHPLVGLGGTGAIQQGALVFTLDGQFAGLVLGGGEGVTVAPPDLVIALANELAARPALVAVDLGIALQPLTPALGRAIGTDRGVVVSGVTRDGPSSDQLAAGDAIRAVDGVDVGSIDAFEDRLARRAPGDTVQLSIVRRGTRVEVGVRARAVPSAPPAAAGQAPELGAAFRASRGSGSDVVSVVPDSPAARAGLEPGDLVTRVNEISSPAPRQIAQAWVDAAAGSALLVVVARASTPLVVAIEKP